MGEGSPRKTCINKVLFEEIKQAQAWWQEGVPLKRISDRLHWSDNLLKRVMNISRQCDEEFFPERRRRNAKCIARNLDSEAPPSLDKQRAARVRNAPKGGKVYAPVKVRRPSDFIKRKFVDPTLSLPDRRTSV